MTPIRGELCTNSHSNEYIVCTESLSSEPGVYIPIKYEFVMLLFSMKNREQIERTNCVHLMNLLNCINNGKNYKTHDNKTQLIA